MDAVKDRRGVLWDYSFPVNDPAANLDIRGTGNELWMDGLGEPGGGKFVAHAFFLGALIYDRTGGGELKAEAKIVEETGHLAVVIPALGVAGDEFGKRWEGIEI